jgi:hypothetical protein
MRLICHLVTRGAWQELDNRNIGNARVLDTALRPRNYMRSWYIIKCTQIVFPVEK